ncbi:hypothetical protein [Enterobacter sichuanensis]
MQTELVVPTREKLALLEPRVTEVENRNPPEHVTPAPALPPGDDQP